jgi:predicted nucleotide-binding protein (sugar kinase/HSP70/actin superfamily)
VGVAGHLYNVHDGQVSLDILDRVRSMGAEPVTVEQVPKRYVRQQLKTLRRKIRWDFESRLVGAVLHWSRTASVAGVIYLNSFACGPGSMIGALLEDEMRREGSIPMMSITLDEHSAEMGLNTRIEAFLDLLKKASGGGGAS